MYKCEKLLKNARRPEVLVKEIKVSRYIHFVSLFTLLNDRGTQPFNKFAFSPPTDEEFQYSNKYFIDILSICIEFLKQFFADIFPIWFEMIYIFTQLLKMKGFQKLKKRISVKKNV